jgi:GNAT superfamily N-acetyltransferase
MHLLSISRDGYLISNDKSKLDIPLIHDYLCNQSYWSKGVALEKVQRSIEHSLTFGVFHGENQVGFSRVISDFTHIAYLGDVFILPAYRGKGLSKWMVETIVQHPDLQDLRRWILLTSDAHGLYAQYGWQPIAQTELWMERV